MFITLEDKVEEYIPRDVDQDYVVKNLIQEVEHKPECKDPEIKLSYETVETQSPDGTYDNSKKILIAGCMCGAKAAVDVSQGYVTVAKEQDVKEKTSQKYSSSKTDSMAKSYY